MGKGRGGGKTPERVVELLKKAVAEKSQSAVARESGLALLTVQRYLRGVGEPTTATFQKLSDYFEVPVPWLRGENYSMHKMMQDLEAMLSELESEYAKELVTEVIKFLDEFIETIEFGDKVGHEQQQLLLSIIQKHRKLLSEKS